MRAAVAAKQEAYAGSEEALMRIDELIDQSIEQERERSDELSASSWTWKARSRAYEGIQQRYFAQAFPNSDETFHYIMAHSSRICSRCRASGRLPKPAPRLSCI